MAQTKDEEVEEKKEGDENGAVSETILEESRDPDEAKQAEAAIKHFIRDRLDEFHDQMDLAVDELEAWILSQSQEDQKLFAERGYFDALGDHFIDQLFEISGGKGTPIGDALAGEAYNTVSFAEHSVFQVDLFLNELRRSVRDACWFVRDASQSILANQWADLLDLATAGETEFIPALFKLGLPTPKFSGKEHGQELTEHADAYRKSVAPAKEQVADKGMDKPVDEEKEAEAEEATEEMDQDVLDETKKEAQAATA